MNLLLFRGDEFSPNFYRHSGVDVDNSFYLKIGERETLLVPKLNERAAKLAFKKGKAKAYSKYVLDIIPLIKGKEVMMDYSSLPARIFERLSRYCKPIDSSELLFAERAVKNPEEIGKIKKAASYSKKILSEIGHFNCGSETDLRNALQIRALESNLELAFEPVIGSGSHSAFPHYKTGSSKVRDFVLVDFGVKYNHYCSDITRVYFSGRGKNGAKKRKVLEAYVKLQEIFYGILDALPDFETGKEVALFADSLFKKYNLPEPIHSIGHGVGLDIHEYPRLNKKYEDKIKGTVMAIEPGAYFSDFGVRFEETVYFDGKKARIL